MPKSFLRLSLNFPNKKKYSKNGERRQFQMRVIQEPPGASGRVRVVDGQVGQVSFVT
jgi:hypothetical protein